MRKRHVATVAVLLVVILGSVFISPLSDKEISACPANVFSVETRISGSYGDELIPCSISADTIYYPVCNGSVSDEEQVLFQAVLLSSEKTNLESKNREESFETMVSKPATNDQSRQNQSAPDPSTRQTNQLQTQEEASQGFVQPEIRIIHHEAEYQIIHHEAETIHHYAVIVHHDAEYETVHHDAVTEEREVVDSDAYCSFRYTIICCTAPECCCEGETDWHKYFKSQFSAKDHDYNMEKLLKAYSAHEYRHLTDGGQGSFTDLTVEGRADASMYESLLSEQSKTPRAVTGLKLVPKQSHTETVTIKEAYEEQLLVKEPWDEVISEAYDEVIPAWDERVLVKEAWDEIVP